METTAMYNNPMSDRNDSIRKLKSSLTLDLTTPKKQSQLPFDGGILSSPDVRMLKLATPELDRLLLQHQMTNSACGGGGGGSGGLAGTQIWFPKSVSEEQEAYARGFVDALLELHSKREVAAAAAAAAAVASAAVADNSSCVTGARDRRVDISTGYDFSSSLDLSKAGGANSGCDSRAYPYLPHPPPPPTPRHPSAPAYPGGGGGGGGGSFFDSPPSSNGHCVDLSRSVEQTHVAFDRGQTGSTFAPSNHAVRLKPESNHRGPKELRTPSYGTDYSCNAVWGATSSSSVPPISFLSDTPPISPIDMAQQEAIKLARKRARNRLAATRCRNRKLERISKLQERVDELKEQNVQLTNTAAELRETISRMRQEINEHVTGGCRLLPSNQHLSLMNLV